MNERKQYFNFITLLRALAAIIITNAHYTGIYPSDIIANGGLLGDVIFFSVSGFCLASPVLSFGKWYAKRLWRIYSVVWIATLVFSLLGAWYVNSVLDVVKWFIHPTHYHFIASITLLYIPLYFVSRYIELNRTNYALAAFGLLGAQLFLYIIIYDRSYYHIDTVREPMIEFLFFQSMLLGLFFRQKCISGSFLINKKSVGQKAALWVCMFVMLVVYFVSKLLFVKCTSLSEIQLLNQGVLFVVLYLLFNCTYMLEDKLKELSNKKMWCGVKFLSDHTLEIYCVQYVIIEWIRNAKLPFPINWVVLTAAILLAATVLRWTSQKVIALIKI